MAEPAQQYADGPVAALRRIAFLLERAREDTFKVKAFRSAAATVLPMPADELRRPRRGRHPHRPARDRQELGAGDRGRLAGAAARPAGPARGASRPARSRPAGAEIRAALRGDLHSHSDWSDGGSPIEEMAFTAMELGHDYLVLTDHSPRLKVARGLSAERLARQLDVVEAVNEHLGGTASGCSRASRSTSSTTARSTRPTRCSAASTCASPACTPSWPMEAPRDDQADGRPRSGNPRTNVLGHCTGRLVTGNRGTRDQSQFDARAVFEACAENDVAVEINSRPERRDPPTKLLELARDIGCLFSIDSDAHAPGQLDFLAYGAERAEAAGIEPERIVNTWPVDRLLAWANG